MASVPLYDMSGAEVGDFKIESSDLVNSINKQLLHDVVVMYQANLRQGSKKTKTRAEVAGTTKKMYRQKGTGNARAGSRRSGIRRGGGHIKALAPRDFSYRLPRKACRLATRMAVASKIQDGQLVVVDGLNCDQPQTKQIVNLLAGIGVLGGTVLMVTNGYNPLVYKSGRNISGVTLLPDADLNAYAVLRPRTVLFDKGALEEFASKAKEQLQAKAAALAAV